MKLSHLSHPDGDIEEAEYECYCQICAEPIQQPPTWSTEQMRMWFDDDTELKLCDNCVDE